MENQLAYIAGFLDGEGTCVVGKYKVKGIKNLAYRGFMSIANTHIPVLKSIQKIMGGRIVEQGLGKGCYSLTFSTNAIRQWLPELLPYLIVKKKQARVLLSFLEKQDCNGSRPVSNNKELCDYYEFCYQELKRLKLIRYRFKEKKVSRGFRTCKECGISFELFSTQSSTKVYCTNHCKRKARWTRYNHTVSERNRVIKLI